MKKAFTLIELLVVIAIIAILAAILFPVFAQAKEAAKQTQTLSNAKNMGTAVNIYLADYDDTFPMSTSFNNAAGLWRWNTIIQFPVGWRGGAFSTEPRRSEDASMWGNAVFPYVKSTGIYAIAGASSLTIAAPTVANSILPADNGFAYNGLLHSYSATAVASPSSLPLMHTGAGKQNYKGFLLSNPNLLCDQASPSCSYNPGRHPQTGAVGQGGTMFFAWTCGVNTGNVKYQVHSNNSIYVRADSSAKSQRIAMASRATIAATPGPATDFRTDPNTDYLPGGTCAQSYWWDGSHPWLFRPDYQP